MKRSYRPYTKPITLTEYGGLQNAFDFFKDNLFDEREMPDVLITYQRKARSRGFFGADRFNVRERGFGIQGRHEIALNPDGFIGRSDEEILSTLVHEMVHLWQHLFGTPARRGYHDREWAAKMKLLGLQPSSTGKPGGKETGAHMTHYVVPDGAFQKAFQQLSKSGWKLRLESAIGEPNAKIAKVKDSSKTPFTCPTCGLNAWAKQDAQLICATCSLLLQPR
ncbi:MAG TPA: SprT-like domain-containing protein [Verrucomicrobiae bacterium]|jgi:predicted SprT family Zn-dependent metalloprotease